MAAWWHNLSLHNKLQIPIQLLLLLVLVLAQVWITQEFEKKLFEDAEQKAISSATQSFLGLKAMMLNGIINQPQARITYFKKMAGQDGVEDFRLVRGKPVQDQFGQGLPDEQARDAYDRNALATGKIQIQRLGKGAQALRVVVPFAAGMDFHGTDCLQCHHVRDGDINGAVSLTISLAREYAELKKVRSLLSIGQVLLQILLFFLIAFSIRKALSSVVKLEKTMLAIETDGDFSKRATVESGDEVGHIATVFNEFLNHIEELRQRLESKVAVLKKYRSRAEEEQRVGGFIMAQITQMPESLATLVLRHMRPVEPLSGDILIAAKSPNGTYILLADAVGHGLSAAINVLPLCQTFYDLTAKGFSVAQIAEDLNRLVHTLMPADRFVSAALISIHHSTRVIEVWNGGIPAPLLFGRDRNLLQRWESGNLPLGITPGDQFSSRVESFQYQEDCQLFLFSDGLPEACSPHGEAFGETRLISLLSRTVYEQRMPALIAEIEAHLGGAAAHDDISLAMVNICRETEAEKHSPQSNLGKPHHAGGDWRIAISLGAAELKYLDIVPLLTQIIAKIDVTREHHSTLFMILSELFNNALDHGLLQLDSTLKREPDGFDKYIELRDSKLCALQNGKIEIEIIPLSIAGKPAVKIRVRDSSDGFDHAAFAAIPIDHSAAIPYGRGIDLVRSVAYELEFLKHGSEVVASYICA